MVDGKGQSLYFWQDAWNISDKISDLDVGKMWKWLWILWRKNIWLFLKLIKLLIDQLLKGQEWMLGKNFDLSGSRDYCIGVWLDGGKKDVG